MLSARRLVLGRSEGFGLVAAAATSCLTGASAKASGGGYSSRSACGPVDMKGCSGGVVSLGYGGEGVGVGHGTEGVGHGYSSKISGNGYFSGRMGGYCCGLMVGGEKGLGYGSGGKGLGYGSGGKGYGSGGKDCRGYYSGGKGDAPPRPRLPNNLTVNQLYLVRLIEEAKEESRKECMQLVKDQLKLSDELNQFTAMERDAVHEIVLKFQMRIWYVCLFLGGGYLGFVSSATTAGVPGL